MNIRTKITTLFTLLVTVILLLLSFSVYYFTSLERQSSFELRLKRRASNYAQIFSAFSNPDSSRLFLHQIDSGSANLLPNKGVTIYNDLNQPVYRYNSNRGDSINVDKKLLEEARSKKSVLFHIGNKEAFAFYYANEKQRIVVVTASHDEEGWDRLGQLADILLISLFVGIAAAAFAGYVFSVQLVKPIAQIIHEVKDISSQNLSHRIQAGKTQDELNQLANTFNDLLNRLQESFYIQRRFISNASHELNTPLTSISSQLEVTLNKERSTEEYKQVMQSIREDVQDMQNLTRSLLEIAKTGSAGSIELQEIRIDEVLFKVMADVQKISPSYKVDIYFGEFPDDEKSFMVFGNFELLYISIKNIVENGCKFSPDHQSQVELQFAREEVIVQVKNEGDSIAEEEMDNIFQPFYRAPSAAPVKGFGLGLALAKRIIGFHKGIIAVQSDIATGTVFTITIPSVKVFALR